MQVGAVGGGASAPQASGKKDQVLESIRKQIEETRKQLKEVAKDDSLSPEVKRQRQKELNEQLADLQKQLTERQTQITQEAQEAAKKSKGGVQKVQDPEAQGKLEAAGRAQGSLSGDQMQDMISMDAAMKQGRKMDSVRISQEGRARVLEQEIKLDSGRTGGVTPSKLEEKADVESALRSTTGEMFKSIAEVNGAAAQNVQAVPSKEETDASSLEKAGDKDKDGKERDEDEENPTRTHIDTYA